GVPPQPRPPRRLVEERDQVSEFLEAQVPEQEVELLASEVALQHLRPALVDLRKLRDRVKRDELADRRELEPLVQEDQLDADRALGGALGPALVQVLREILWLQRECQL